MKKENENKGFMDWYESYKGKKVVGAVYSLGASVVIIGALFKIMHFPGAGAMLMVRVWRGFPYPFTVSAAMIRSWLSLTALSGSPTSVNSNPGTACTSILTITASMPCGAAP